MRTFFVLKTFVTFKPRIINGEIFPGDEKVKVEAGTTLYERGQSKNKLLVYLQTVKGEFVQIATQMIPKMEIGGFISEKQR